MGIIMFAKSGVPFTHWLVYVTIHPQTTWCMCVVDTLMHFIYMV